MIGAIVGAGISAIGSIAGGIMGGKAARKQKQMIEDQRRKNQNWYDRRYNEDSTQRADAQRLLTITEDSIRRRNKAAAGTQAVMGGTAESVAAAKEANNEALSDAVSRIAAQGDARKDSIEERYMAADDGYAATLAGIEAQRAQNIASATKGVTSAAGSIAGNIGSIGSAEGIGSIVEGAKS